MPDQPDLRQRLAEAIFQHSVCDCGEYADDFNEQCMHVAGRLLALPGIAIVDAEVLRTALNFGYGKEPTPQGAICRANLREQLAGVAEEHHA